MPLNINEPGGDELPDKNQRPGPILHTPTGDGGALKKILVACLVLIVLGSACYLIYMFAVKKGHPGSGRPAQAAGQKPAVSDTASGRGAVAQAPAGKSAATSVTAKQAAAPVRSTAGAAHGFGKYTIFISSYPDKMPAEEEVGRWQGAGFESFVIEAAGHYRVALGEYSGVSKARQAASRLEEAFENGYWIGPLPG